MQLKQNFFKKSSGTQILTTCYNSIQSYFKIDLDLNDKVFQCLLSTSKIMNLLDTANEFAQSWTRIKYNVPIFDICSLQMGNWYRSKKQLCRMFQYSSVNVCICTSIS